MKPILLTLLLAFAAYYGWTHRSGNDAATADLSAIQIQTLAASVKAEEVVMYNTSDHPVSRCRCRGLCLGKAGRADYLQRYG